MKQTSENKRKQIISSSSSQSVNNTNSLGYATNFSVDKYKKEVPIHELSGDIGNSIHKTKYKLLSPNKKYNKSLEMENVIVVEKPTFESPERSKSYLSSKQSSCKKISKNDPIEIKEFESINETPLEDENIETVKLDSSKLRSQKRGLPIDQRSSKEEETPKNSNKQRYEPNIDDN